MRIHVKIIHWMKKGSFSFQIRFQFLQTIDNTQWNYYKIICTCMILRHTYNLNMNFKLNLHGLLTSTLVLEWFQTTFSSSESWLWRYSRIPPLNKKHVLHYLANAFISTLLHVTYFSTCIFHSNMYRSVGIVLGILAPNWIISWIQYFNGLWIILPQSWSISVILSN